MDKFIRNLRKEELLVEHGGFFDEENAERVTTWLVAAENLRPVVLVGAGFSRNARSKSTGELASEAQVPLWRDVAARLAEELGVEPSMSDAPTLFEMYLEVFRPAKLRDALRATTDDDDLRPGRAHEALARYPSVAIVTMNCLDTLLDKACVGSWRKVVDDTDLAAAGDKSELIYLHGHRDQPASWVMTRSQYEDLHTHKPVIMSRVRQLLAQHPWLVVGYSLTDLDFHAVTRLVAREMRGHRPLSLVLSTSVPTAAVRQHWRGLGFEIVTPTLRRSETEALTMDQALEWCFDHLRTSYEADRDAVNEYARRGSTKADQLSRHRDASAHLNVSRREAYSDWESLLVSQLSQEQRHDAEEHARAHSQASYRRNFPRPKEGADLSADPETRREPPPLREPIATITKMPRFESMLERKLVWWVHALWSDPQLHRSIAEYFAWALERELFEEASEPWFLVALTLRFAHEAGLGRPRVQSLFRAAFGIAQRYDDDDARELLTTLAPAIECSVIEAAEHPLPAWAVQAARGYRAYMNAEFDEAAECYERAGTLAAQAGRAFERWVYTRGRAQAVARSAEALRWGKPTADRTAVDALKQRARALHEEGERLEAEGEVARWLKSARHRSEALLKETIDGLLQRRRREQSGDWGMRVSASGYYAWRTYREVCFAQASPELRRSYLEPLLPTAPLELLHDVFAHAPSPRTWLSDRLRDWSGSLEARRERDAQVVQVLFAEDSTLTELAARLECLPSLRVVLRRSDSGRAFTWLVKCAKELGGGWKACADGSRAVDGYWLAFAAIATWTEATPKQALDAAEKLAEHLRGQGGSLAEGLYGLPWSSWRLSNEDEAKSFFELLSRHLDPGAEPSPRGRQGDDNAVFTLRRMLDAGLDASVVQAQLGTWTALLDRLQHADLERTTHSEGKRAGFWLDRKLIELGLVEPREMDATFLRWFPRVAQPTTDEPDHRSEVWNVLAELIESKNLADGLRDHLREEIECVLCDASRAFFLNNPHLSYAPKRLLARSLPMLDDMRERISDWLLTMFCKAPDYLQVIGPSLDPALWQPAQWTKLRGMLLAATGGSVVAPAERDDDGRSARAQFEVLDLAARLEPNQLQKLGHTGSAMKALALSCATDARPTIANHAAFAVVHLAKHACDDEATEFASTLERMATDARVPVRLALADGAIALSNNAASTDVVQAAQKALGLLEADDNGQVWRVLERARSREAAERAKSGDRQP